MASIEGNFDRENYNPGMWKNKKISKDDDETILILSIMQAEGVDDPFLNPFTLNRIYKVISWVEIENQCVTQEVYGLPNPIWNIQFCLRLKNPMNCKFLYLEVIRSRSISDPGTSTGDVLMGRVKLALPKLSTKQVGLFKLVKPDGPGHKVEGHIKLAMELRKN